MNRYTLPGSLYSESPIIIFGQDLAFLRMTKNMSAPSHVCDVTLDFQH